jgi:hypothetical protein
MVAGDVGFESSLLETVKFLKPEAGVGDGIFIHFLGDEEMEVLVIGPLLEGDFVEVVVVFIGIQIGQLI